MKDATAKKPVFRTKVTGKDVYKRQAVTGRLCLPRFLAYLEQGDFKPFVIYRIAFGLLLLLSLIKGY